MRWSIVSVIEYEFQAYPSRRIHIQSRRQWQQCLSTSRAYHIFNDRGLQSLESHVFESEQMTTAARTERMLNDQEHERWSENTRGIPKRLCLVWTGETSFLIVGNYRFINRNWSIKVFSILLKTIESVNLLMIINNCFPQDSDSRTFHMAIKHKWSLICLRRLKLS